MIYYLGDTLSIGLNDELENKFDDMPHFYAAIVCLYMQEYISKDTMIRIKETIIMDKNDDKDPNALAEKVFRVLLKDLKQKFRFTDYDEMVNKMNQIIIPDLIQVNHKELFSMCPDVFQYNERLYYLSKEKEVLFVCHLAEVSIIDMEVFDLFDISTGLIEAVNSIMGFDRDNGVFYLQMYNSRNWYAEYHINDDKLCVEHMSFEYMFHNKVPFLRNEKDEFFYKLETGLKPVMTLAPGESYKILDNYYMILPKRQNAHMFKPYLLQRNGIKLEDNYAIAKDYLLTHLKVDTMPFRYRVIANIEEESELRLYDCFENLDPSVLTLKEIRESCFDEEKEADGFQRGLLQNLIELLSKYISDEDDVLDLFYILSEFSCRVKKHYDDIFMDMEVLIELYELEDKGELEECLKDQRLLREKLLSKVYWYDERIKAHQLNETRHFKLGSFEFAGDILRKTFVEEKDCIFVGGSRMLPGYSWPYKGFIAYNNRISIWEIYYERALTEKEIEKIAAEFSIPYEDDIRMVIHL